MKREKTTLKEQAQEVISKNPAAIEKIPPICRCGGVLKPSIVFFGEEIPYEALREAVINAVIHRDYFEKGANVMVEIFDDSA